MIWHSIGKIHGLVHKSVEVVLKALIYVAFAVAVAHRVGWLDRWIWFILEKEAHKLTNGTQITIGGFTIDWSEIFQGKITLHASNVVVHTPQRDEWQWDSPLIARVGKATVECNALITVFHVVFLRREVPIEAYTVILADAQVFVERRDSVINVYLLNPMLQLPPPPFPKKDDGNECQNHGTKIDLHSGIGDSDDKTEFQRKNLEAPTSNSAVSSDITDVASPNGVDDSDRDTKTPSNNRNLQSNRNNHNQQAKVLVNEMLQAVQVLGGAAARGQLPGAIKQQGLELMGRLQGFREQENLEEGIRVMQQMGKVAVESLQSAPQYILPKPDSTREGEKKVVYIRIGRIVASDLRIFTKDSWINPKNSQDDVVLDSVVGNATGTPKTTSVSTPLAKTMKNGAPKPAIITSGGDTSTHQSGNWNKPIFIERLVLRSSELCPPMSMKDSDNLPAIYQSIDKVVEVVWRRLLAEVAKSNTGKLFSTAMGEVLSVMVSNPQHAISLPSTTGVPNTASNAPTAIA